MSNITQKRKTAFYPLSGGCFSFLLFPPVTIFLLTIFYLLAFGDTSSPLTLDPAPGEANRFDDLEQGNLSGVFSQEVQYWKAKILTWANEWNLEPNVVATIMQIESCGDPNAVSFAGAAGLFQVMPFHFSSGENRFAPDTNAYRGLAYFRKALDAFAGNFRLAFAGYNGGISTAHKQELYWPNETQRYVYWAENIFTEANRNMGTSPTLNEWLNSGGASLCNQAQVHLGLFP